MSFCSFVITIIAWHYYRITYRGFKQNGKDLEIIRQSKRSKSTLETMKVHNVVSSVVMVDITFTDR